MKRPLHERALELAGIHEASNKNSGSYYLEQLLDKLVKKGIMGKGDAQHILTNIWMQEPRNVQAMDDFINGDHLAGEPKFPAKDIFNAYQRDVKAGEKRSQY